MSLIEKLKNLLLRKSNFNNISISLNSEGFFINHVCNYWNDVTEIIGYKIDLFTYDSVRIRLTLDKQISVEIDEDQSGFDDFAVELEKRFPSIKDWRLKIIQPPFARNETLLYSRT
jgi:hypothetical protein